MAIRPILSSLGKHRIAAILIVLEIALAFAIVSNTVFLIRDRMQRMDMPSGIAEHELVEVQVAGNGSGPKADARARADLAALRRIPGVRQAGLVDQLPFGDSSSNGGVTLSPQQKQPTLNATEYYGQNLLRTLGVRLLAGRTFRPEEYIDLDTAIHQLDSGHLKGLPQTVIITRGLGERLWPGQNALGKTLYLGDHLPFRVVGVISRLVRPDGMHLGADYSMVLPVHIHAGEGSYVLRSAPQERARILKAAVSALKRADPTRIIVEHRTYDAMRRTFFQNDRAMAGILAGVIVALLLITALGIYGLASFWVQQRTRQIGVRRALGARRLDILRYFQTENLLLSSAGIALGCLAAVGINLWLMTRYEIPRLPLSYLPVGALMLWGLGQLSVLSPALRAAAVPPAIAVRSA